jgi:hypothetical protein
LSETIPYLKSHIFLSLKRRKDVVKLESGGGLSDALIYQTQRMKIYQDLIRMKCSTKCQPQRFMHVHYNVLRSSFCTVDEPGLEFLAPRRFRLVENFLISTLTRPRTNHKN